MCYALAKLILKMMALGIELLTARDQLGSGNQLRWLPKFIQGNLSSPPPPKIRQRPTDVQVQPEPKIFGGAGDEK